MLNENKYFHTTYFNMFTKLDFGGFTSSSLLKCKTDDDSSFYD